MSTAEAFLEWNLWAEGILVNDEWMVALGSQGVSQNIVALEHIFGETPISLWKRVTDSVPLKGRNYVLFILTYPSLTQCLSQ